MDTQHIHDFTLMARSLLIKEAAELLDGVFGIDSEGRFAPEEKLSVLRELPEAAETYRRLKKHLEDEKEAGLSPAEAVSKLLKEVAFTHLNRLVALKMLEARKLVRGTIDRHHESNAFKFYLAENPKEEQEYKQGLMPQNGIGEGPRDAAYRRFILEQYRRLSEEIKVLFDPDNLASRLFPRPRVLKQVIDALNSDKLTAAWQPGNEETIGWVYQFFNEQEKKGAFRRVFQEKKKFQREDIPAATQVFTTRWIVKFLVQNSLGRMWVSMHPDSELVEKLDYLVPLAGDLPRQPLKPLRDIRLLDPATGTMHFGLVAFDLLVEMYREELARAGQDGWPETPSVSTEAEIPTAIVANNLFGIDIDLRAVQLSALTLYVKAKHANKNAAFNESNLACADILPIYGKHLDEFLVSVKFSDPLYERVIRALWKRLEPASYMGSLVRVDEALREIVEQERKKFRKKPDGKMVLPGFETVLKSEDEFWVVLEAQIIQTLDEFARQQAAKGFDESYFAGEAKKGMRIVDLLTRRYDVVLTNPPYMSSRNMSGPMIEFIKQEYPQSKGDLYAAFIERCASLLSEGGRVAMITQQSFMFISSYEDMRKGLLDSTAIESMAHTGPRAFEEVTGEKVNTTAFVLRRETDASIREGSVGTYFRLIKEPDADAKRDAFQQALERRTQGEDDPRVYVYRQGDFGTIPGSPWVYWITASLRELFIRLPKLGDVTTPRMGMGTRNNFRFLRYWWECGFERIERGFREPSDLRDSDARWFPYMKGGSFQRWYGNQDFTVNFWHHGVELKEEQLQKYPYLNGNTGWIVPIEDVIFRRGVTWSDLTSGRFSARLSPGGFIFDVKGSSAFPADIELLLGLLNSSFANYALNLINPTVSYQVGDLARLPVPREASSALRDLVNDAVTLTRMNAENDESTYDFVMPPGWPEGIDVVAQRTKELTDLEKAIDEEVYRLYAISDDDKKVIDAELRSLVDEQAGENEADEETEEGAPVEIPLTSQELAQRWICYAIGISLGRFHPGVEGATGKGRFTAEISKRLSDLADPDGIMVLDAGHSDDLASRVVQILEAAVSDAEAIRIVRAVLDDQTANTDSLRDWLSRTFFKDHVKLYRKRPVYWLLESPKKKYGLYLLHQKATKDTLPLIRGPKYLGGRINRAKDEIAHLAKQEQSATGATKTKYRRQREDIEELLEDLEAFDKNLAEAMSVEIEDANGRKATVGWAPEIDDGILINMAPIWVLFPSWKDEPKKCWEKIKKGDYDWSHTAMRYWPKRVLEACKKNKSYAIAHGL